MITRIALHKLIQLFKGLDHSDYQLVRCDLGLHKGKIDNDSKLDQMCTALRSAETCTKQELIKLVGCTETTFRSYKSRVVESLLKVLIKKNPSFDNDALDRIRRAWVWSNVGEYKTAYDLAESVYNEASKRERGAIARLALEVMSTTVQEAYPDETIERLEEVSNGLFKLAGDFFSSSGLYQLYLTASSWSAKSILIRTHDQHSRWLALVQRADTHHQKKDYPLSHWAYLVLAKSTISELGGEMEEAFNWYNRLWEYLISNKSLPAGDKRMLSSCQSYIVLAIKARKQQQLTSAIAEYENHINQYHSADKQQLAFLEVFKLVATGFKANPESIIEDLGVLMTKMCSAKVGSTFYHKNWSPHLRYELYNFLFNLSFKAKQWKYCSMLLIWSDDRKRKTQTASDFEKLVPLLTLVVKLQLHQELPKTERQNLSSELSTLSNSAYDKYRRMGEGYEIEKCISKYLNDLINGSSDKLEEKRRAVLNNLQALREETYYYSNLMRYFNFEHWIREFKQ